MKKKRKVNVSLFRIETALKWCSYVNCKAVISGMTASVKISQVMSHFGVNYIIHMFIKVGIFVALKEFNFETIDEMVCVITRWLVVQSHGSFCTDQLAL